MAAVFISYRRIAPDCDVAGLLHAKLNNEGISAFIDTQIPLGADWSQRIEQALDGAEFSCCCSPIARS